MYVVRENLMEMKTMNKTKKEEYKTIKKGATQRLKELSEFWGDGQ